MFECALKKPKKLPTFWGAEEIRAGLAINSFVWPNDTMLALWLMADGKSDVYPQ